LLTSTTDPPLTRTILVEEIKFNQCCVLLSITPDLIKTMPFGIPKNLLLLSLLLLFLIGCNQQVTTSRELLAGTSSKKWRSTGKTRPAIHPEIPTGIDSIRFFAQGTFTKQNGQQSSTGTWIYNDITRTLSLQYPDQNLIQNFQMLELTANQIQLQTVYEQIITLRSE
jgi:hypothetical protein